MSIVEPKIESLRALSDRYLRSLRLAFVEHVKIEGQRGNRNQARFWNEIASQIVIEQMRRQQICDELERTTWPVEITWTECDSWDMRE